MPKTIKLLISLIVAAILIFLLARSFNFSDFITLFYKVNWLYVFLAFLFYLLVNFARSWRFRLLLGNSAMFRDVASISFIHNFLVSLLPFRAGELSYVYLLKKYRGISISTGLGTLFLARFFDILIVANLVILAVFFVSQSRLPKEIAVMTLALAILALSLSLILIFFTGFLMKAFSFLFRTRLFFSSAQGSSPHQRDRGWDVAEESRIVSQGEGHEVSQPFWWGDSLGNISAIFLSVREKAYFLKLFFLSFLIWLLNFGVGVFLFRSLSFGFNFLETVFIFSLPMIVSEFSPIQSFANLGLYEWSLVGGLVIFGISRDMAAQSSILIHGIELIFSLLLGLAGFLVLFIAKHDKHN